MAGYERVKVVGGAGGRGGFFFLLAYLGAAIYFISTSDGSFWGVVLGLLQAIVWPVLPRVPRAPAARGVTPRRRAGVSTRPSRANP